MKTNEVLSREAFVQLLEQMYELEDHRIVESARAGALAADQEQSSPILWSLSNGYRSVRLHLIRARRRRNQR